MEERDAQNTTRPSDVPPDWLRRGGPDGAGGNSAPVNRLDHDQKQNVSPCDSKESGDGHHTASDGEGDGRPEGEVETGAWPCNNDGCTKVGRSKCKRCKLVRYCCVGCQAEHWQKAHRGDCGISAASARTAAAAPAPFTGESKSKKAAAAVERRCAANGCLAKAVFACQRCRKVEYCGKSCTATSTSFWTFSRISQLHLPPTRAVDHALLGDHADRRLIGVWNPML